MTILIAIPTIDMVSHKWVNAYYKMAFPLNTQGEILWEVGEKLSVAEKRNKIVRYAIDKNFDYIFFLDDDVLVTPDTLSRLWAHQKDYVGGVYYSKTNPSFPLIFNERGKGSILNYPDNTLFQCYGNGLGCSLIKTDLFKRMREDIGSDEWFVENKDGSKYTHQTEEFRFWDWLKANNIPVYVDTEIQCGHYDKIKKEIYAYKTWESKE